jgi:hypothetical protein
MPIITMGMVVVAFFATNAGFPPVTTITSTLRRTRSAASSGRRSDFPSANRYPMVIFYPSIHPSLVSSCRNASTRTLLPETVLGSRKRHSPLQIWFQGLLQAKNEHRVKKSSMCAGVLPARTLIAGRSEQK